MVTKFAYVLQTYNHHFKGICKLFPVAAVLLRLQRIKKNWHTS